MSVHSQFLLEPLGTLGPLADGDASSARTINAPLRARIREAVLSYLPLMLVALLALGTWWLVRNTRLPEQTPIAAPPRHEPDYAMQVFSVQRFAPDGSLRAQIDGDLLRHYPDTDTLEIDNPRIKAYAPDGRVTLATAGRALANGDATEAQLIGNAQVTRDVIGTGVALRFSGELLHAFFKTEQVRSPLPVAITRGNTELRADALRYDNRGRTMLLQGNVRASFAPVGSNQHVGP